MFSCFPSTDDVRAQNRVLMPCAHIAMRNVERMPMVSLIGGRFRVSEMKSKTLCSGSWCG